MLFFLYINGWECSNVYIELYSTSFTCTIQLVPLKKYILLSIIKIIYNEIMKVILDIVTPIVT